jgi:hypothetical protein
MADWDDRFAELARHQGGHHVEDDLLHSTVDEWLPAIVSTNRIDPVKLSSGRHAAYKRWDGLSINAARLYQHTRTSTMLAECAAWRLARVIGPPVEELVPPCVWRDDLTPDTGSLAEWREGDALGMEAVHSAPDQAWAAAFFDALAGQQDRNWSNLLWDAASGRLSLHDNGYAFACPGHRRNASFFVSERWDHGAELLTAEEEEALSRLLASSDLHGLALFLEEERADALAERARRMLESHTLQGANEY